VKTAGQRQGEARKAEQEEGEVRTDMNRKRARTAGGRGSMTNRKR
jgi:hypothetical protein